MNKELPNPFRGKDHLTPSSNPNDIYESGIGESIVFHRIDKMRGFHNSQILEWQKSYGRLIILFSGVAAIIEGDDRLISSMHVTLQQARLRGVRERGGISIKYTDDPKEEKSDALLEEEKAEHSITPIHYLDYFESGRGECILFYRLNIIRGFNTFKIQHWQKTSGRLTISFGGVAAIIEGDDSLISSMHRLLLQGQLRTIKQKDIKKIRISYSDEKPKVTSL
jgi:hypothetical protein